MTLLGWSNSYSVGVEILDNEHKSLIALMNTLYQQVIDGTATDQLAHNALLELEIHAKTHFLHEEQILEQYRYPGLAEHKLQHQAFFDEIGKFQRLLNFNGISHEVVRFLLDWVLCHILKDDRHYSDFLKSKGVC